MHSILTIIVFILIILSPAIILIPFIFWLGNHQNKKVWKQTILLAYQLHIPLYGKDEKHKMYDFPHLRGYFKNRKVEVYTKETGSGRTRSRATFISMNCKQHLNFRFTLHKKNLLNGLLIFFQKKPVEINFSGFSRKFVLYGTDEESLKRIFNHDVCECLMKTDFIWRSTIIFSNSQIEYTENSLILSETTKNRFLSMVSICHLLCEHIDK
jgi:hypothetical protein